MRRVSIEEFLQGCQNAILLDVRSPGEFNHAHIPGAINLPLFTDDERKVVGTTYKQSSRQAAIKTGLDYFGPKMRGMVEEVERLVQSRKVQSSKLSQAARETADFELLTENSVFIYCWRGGMRSGAVAWLLNLYGFKVTVLAGGYKTYRNHVLQSFEQPYNFKILGGYTGSGKTEILQQLMKNGEKVIDLEAIACHKGSAFGNINMPPQPSQEMFENLLSEELRIVNSDWQAASSNKNGSTADHSRCTIWLEDESQRIGTINLPNSFWKTMRNAPLYFVEIPFEERLNHIEEEYSQCEKARLLSAIDRIKKRLGGLETKNAIHYLEEGNIRECFSTLLHYYDKQYLKGLHSRESLPVLLTKIYVDKVSVENAGLVSQAQHASTYAGNH